RGWPRARRERYAVAPPWSELRRGSRWRDEEDVRPEPRIPETAPGWGPLDSPNQYPPGAPRAAGVRADGTLSRVPEVQGGGADVDRPRDAAPRDSRGHGPPRRLPRNPRRSCDVRSTDRHLPDPRRPPVRCDREPIRRRSRRQSRPTVSDGNRVSARREPRADGRDLRAPGHRSQACGTHPQGKAVRLLDVLLLIPLRPIGLGLCGSVLALVRVLCTMAVGL